MGCFLPPCTGKPEGLGEVGCGGPCRRLPSVGLRWFLGVCLLGRVPSLHRRGAVPQAWPLGLAFPAAGVLAKTSVFCPSALPVRSAGRARPSPSELGESVGDRLL